MVEGREDVFDWNRESAETFATNLRSVLEQGWRTARRLLLNAAVPSVDHNDVFMAVDPRHRGDPTHRVDRELHQWIEGWLGSHFLGMQTAGEEGPPTALLLDPTVFNHIAYLDALDGTRQAFVLPGAWSINLVVQKFVGVDRSTKSPRCSVAFLGVIDAEGVSAIWTPAMPGVELKLVDGGGQLPVVSDQLWITEGEDSGITGTTTLLAGGYKPLSWVAYRRLRDGLEDVPSFNTAGAPVTRKALQNADVVVVQLAPSSLWDGIGAGLIAAAGGFVCRLGDTTLLPTETVTGWFNQFGYERRGDPPTLRERFPIPPFIAGMDASRVEKVAIAARGAGLSRSITGLDPDS